MEKITSRKKLTLYGCSGLGVNMLTIMMGSYLCSALLTGGFIDNVAQWTYLSKDLVIAGVWGILVFFAKALDGIIDLPLAAYAERIKSKMGKRKAGLLIGAIPMLVFYCLFLVPLTDGESLLNTIWFGVLLCGFYTFYTLTMLTYYATFAEVCKDEKDLFYLSNTKSICDVVYFSLGFALIPLFISLGMNIRIIALIFLPLVLTMIIPFFLLKENANGAEETVVKEEPLTLGKSLACAAKDKSYIYWMFTAAVMTVGLQLFLGGINEVFSSTGLNMTVVMASSFAPVPLTLMVYNKIVKRFGLGHAFRYVLSIFSVGMLVLLGCLLFSDKINELSMTLIAVLGGVFVSFALGAFFSVTYTVPSHLAQKKFEETGKKVSGMYFAVQGLFEGIAAGIGTGIILVALKDFNVIWLLPIIVCITSAIAFFMSYAFPKTIALMGKEDK